MAELSVSSDCRLVCLVCQKQFSQYTCPRCNVRYCSLPCYKSHSARCCESFNRDNVLSEMRNASVANPETKKRMMETLKKFYLDGGGMDEEEGGFGRLHRYGQESEGEGEEEEDDDDEVDKGINSARKTCVLSEETLSKLASGIPFRSFSAFFFSLFVAEGPLVFAAIIELIPWEAS